VIDVRQGLRTAGVATLLLAGGLQAQVERFRYRPEIAVRNTLFRYEKTNLDGSHRGVIALFVASPDSLESFKYGTGGDEFSLIGAVMDWSAFSVREFTSVRVRASGERKPVAKLTFDAATKELTVSLFGRNESTTIGFVPWHSFDFDFSSLNVAFRHLVDPRRRLKIGVADPTYEEKGPVFRDNGTVDIRYLGMVRRGGVRTRKYRIDGPGLRNHGGHLWVDAAKGHLVELAVHTGDEPGYSSVRLRLLDQRPMDRAGWESFIRAQFGDSTRAR
jgi:hypothetical protein